MPSTITILPQNTAGGYTLPELARQYHAYGLNVIPVRGKRPARDPHTGRPYEWDRWQAERQTAADRAALPWQQATGIAAVCGDVSGGLMCVDFDKQPDRRALDQFMAALKLPADYPWLVITPGGGYHLWLICPGLVLPNRSGKIDRPGKYGGHIEMRYTGHYALLPPSKHPTGQRYRWAGEAPTQAPKGVIL